MKIYTFTSPVTAIAVLALAEPLSEFRGVVVGFGQPYLTELLELLVYVFKASGYSLTPIPYGETTPVFMPLVSVSLGLCEAESSGVEDVFSDFHADGPMAKIGASQLDLVSSVILSSGMQMKVKTPLLGRTRLEIEEIAKTFLESELKLFYDAVLAESLESYYGSSVMTTSGYTGFKQATGEQALVNESNAISHEWDGDTSKLATQKANIFFSKDPMI